MRTDRELLELAAKAADMKLGQYADGWHWVNDGPRGAGIYKIDPNQSPVGNPRFRFIFWNPLTDDGDALRLAVRLGFAVEVDLCDDTTRVSETECELIAKHMHFDGGPEDATRRAIVRAAAKLAKAHPDHKDGGA